MSTFDADLTPLLDFIKISILFLSVMENSKSNSFTFLFFDHLSYVNLSIYISKQSLILS